MAFAADGRIEISQSSIPLTITNAGSYVLTENVTGVSGSNGITILANDVSIDLNGFVMTGVAGSKDGISVPTNNYLRNIEIVNGTLRAWGDDGIDAFTTSNGVLADLGVFSNANTGAKAGFNSIVERCRIFRNGGIPGPSPASTNLLGQGLDVENGSVIRQCVIWQNNSHGISGHSGTILEDSVLWGNGHDGFHASHASIARECVAGFNSEGIEMDSGSEIINCVSSGNKEDGLRCKGDTNAFAIAGGVIIHGSVASMNGDNGIDMAGQGSQSEHCLVYSNGGHGVRTSAGSTFVANLVVLNGIAQVNDAIHIYGGGGRVEGNHVVDNADEGIQVDGDAEDGGNGNLVIRNTICTTGLGGNNPLQFSGPFNSHGYVVTKPLGTTPTNQPWANIVVGP